MQGVGRLLVSVAWVVGQAALVVTGGRRPDAAFAFRMFSESSTIAISLSREVNGAVIPVEDGTWLAHDSRGVLHRFRWDDRVKDGHLFPWKRPIHASYGAAAQLDRLQHALEDVSANIDDDAETARLVADVVVRKNGGPPQAMRLAGPRRAGLLSAGRPASPSP